MDIDLYLAELSADYFIHQVFGDLPGFRGGSGKYICTCPFHEDHNPSFSISNSEGVILYHCFGCNESGNLFQYFQKKFNLSFIDAVYKTAEVTHYPVPQDISQIKDYKPSPKETEFEKYHSQLMSDEKSLTYLKERGIKDFRDFGIDQNGIYKIAYRKYRGIDSIITHIPKEKNPERKYNFETGMKKDYPFNLYQVKNNKEIWLVEGIFDALCLHQNFNLNAVSMLGLEISAANIRFLERFQNIIVCFDNDAKGREGTARGIQKLYKAGFTNVFYVRYDGYPYKDANESFQNKDPDSLKPVLNNISDGYKLLNEEYRKAIQDKNDLQIAKETDHFLDLISQFPLLIQAKTTKDYSVMNGTDIRLEFETYRNTLSFKNYRETLHEIFNTNHDFNPEIINEIKSLTNEVESKTLTFDYYTSTDFIQSLQTPVKRIQSNLIPDIHYYSGALSFVAGRKSHGKTTFLINEAMRYSMKQKIAFFSLEESNKYISAKLFNAWYNTQNPDNIIKLDDFYSLYHKYSQDIHKAFQNIVVFDNPDQLESLEQTILFCNKHLGIDIFIIDYIQRISTNNPVYGKKPRQEEVKYINSRLLKTAKENELYLILGCQLNRTVSSYDEIKKDNAYREAGDIEQDANLIINIWNNHFNDAPQKKSTLSYFIAKNRNGIAGVEGELQYLPDKWLIGDKLKTHGQYLEEDSEGF